jgi:EmrB/QacA subfamily drug resistance transporter
MPASSAVAAPGEPLDHAATRSIIIGILLAMLLAALDQTIVATALPTIGRDLGNIEHLPWVVTVYLLTATAVTPLYGKLSDIHGRRVTLLTAIGIFSLGSLICALSPTMTTLISARALQGLGGGGLISLAQTIIADVVSPKERGRYQGYIAGVFVTSSVAGPVLGGFFADELHWSMIFWINLPLGFLAFKMTNNVLKRLPRHERPHRLDWLGAVLMTAATVAFLLALTWGGTRYPWASFPVVGLLVASLVGWLLFVGRLLTAPEPLLPLSVLGNQVVATGTAAAFFAMGTFIGLTIYVPIYLQTIQGLSASDSGFALIPLMAGTVTGATGSGRVMVNMRRYKLMPIGGLLAAMLALVAMAVRPRALALLEVDVLLCIIGLGIGTVLPVSTVAIQNAVEVHQLGTATATMNFFRSLGGAIAVAIFGAIVLGNVAASGGSIINLDSLAHETAAAGLDLGAIFRWVFIAAAIGLLLGLAAFLAMEERPLRSTIGRAAPAVSE